MSTTTSLSPSTPTELSYRQVLTVLSGLLLGMLLSGLDQTIVSTASRTIGDDLNGLDEQAWLTTAFLITSTITTLIYGKLSDVFGRKLLYMVAITIFLLGSALSGLATSMTMLAAFRALQGLGAGGLMSLAFAITGDIIPPRDRAKYQGYFAATMAASSVIGPLVGGFFAGLPTAWGIEGWRYAFWINLPIGVAALIIVARTLHVDKAATRRRIDGLGAVLLTVGLVPLLLIGEQGSEWGWTSGRAVACYLIGAIGVAGFIAQQVRMKKDALLPLHLLRTRSFAMPVLITFVTGAVQLGGLAVLPLYLQIVRGANPTQSGLLLIPMVLGISAAAIVVGRIVKRTGKTKIFPVIGSAVQVIAFLGLSTVSTSTPLAVVDVWMLLIGVGLGASANTIILILQNSVHFSDLGVATASSTFFRNIGATVGTAVLLSTLFATANTFITAAYRAAQSSAAYISAAKANPAQLALLKKGIAGGLTDTSFLSRIDPALARPYLTGFAHAMDTVSLIAAVLAGVGFVLALLVKEVPLRTMSARAAAAAEAPSVKAP